MSITAGTLSQVLVTSTTAQLAATAATAGTAPYTQQWYRDTSSAGFTPSGSNILTGQTALTLNDTNLVPNTTYYYKVVYTDAVPATATSTALTVTTSVATLSPNQFAMAPFLGELDLKVGPTNVIAAQIGTAQTTPLYAGQAVTIVNDDNGIPNVIAAGTSTVDGYIVYDIKTQAYVAGSRCEIAQTESCMWLYTTSAITRGAQVVIDQAVPNAVRALSGQTGKPIVGYAYDKSSASGQLIRVRLNAPSFLTAP